MYSINNLSINIAESIRCAVFVRKNKSGPAESERAGSEAVEPERPGSSPGEPERFVENPRPSHLVKTN